MTPPLNTVVDGFSVSGQLEPGGLASLKAAGVELLINHRPDGEAPGQPTSAEIEAAARAAGLDYLAIPVRGVPPGDAEARATADAAAGVRTHAFCRSGTRAIMAWAIGEALAGRRRPEDLVRLGADAGYDLRPVFG